MIMLSVALVTALTISSALAQDQLVETAPIVVAGTLYSPGERTSINGLPALL